MQGHHHDPMTNVVSAAGVPVIAATSAFNLPAGIQYLAGILGVLWYVVVFTEKIRFYYHRWKHRHKHDKE